MLPVQAPLASIVYLIEVSTTARLIPRRQSSSWVVGEQARRGDVLQGAGQRFPRDLVLLAPQGLREHHDRDRGRTRLVLLRLRRRRSHRRCPLRPPVGRASPGERRRAILECQRNQSPSGTCRTLNWSAFLQRLGP